VRFRSFGEHTTDATTGLFKRAWGMLQNRFQSREAQSALTVYQSLPQSNDVQALVAQQIVAYFKEDQAAITEFQAIVRELRAATGAPVPQQTNTQIICIGQIHIAHRARRSRGATAAALHCEAHRRGLEVVQHQSDHYNFSRKTIIATPRAGATTPTTSPTGSTARLPQPATLIPIRIQA
jgi:hypothetical protein